MDKHKLDDHGIKQMREAINAAEKNIRRLNGNISAESESLSEFIKKKILVESKPFSESSKKYFLDNIKMRVTKEIYDIN